jgi:hypothetical protein
LFFFLFLIGEKSFAPCRPGKGTTKATRHRERPMLVQRKGCHSFSVFLLFF